MVTVNKKNDRRPERTKQALRNALIQLILEKHYDEITVQHIIDRANIGRSTFYVHFRDKEDVLIGDWERFLDMFIDAIKWENTKNDRFIPFRELLIHLKDFHHFYRALVRSSKLDRIFKTGLDHLSKKIERSLTIFLNDKPKPTIPLPILSNYLAASIFDQLRWWLDNDMPYSPERMDEIFHQLVAANFSFLSEIIENEETVKDVHPAHIGQKSYFSELHK